VSIAFWRKLCPVYFNLNTYLFVEAQIVNIDGSNLEPDTDVGPVDLWMHSLFTDVSVSLSEYQANPIPISYIRKSFGVLEPFLTKISFDVFRSFV
jgi:hypothetical protein